VQAVNTIAACCVSAVSAAASCLPRPVSKVKVVQTNHLDGKPYMKYNIRLAHLDVATRYSKLSTARRLQVGAIVVKDDRIISIGYNGTPSGWDNNCEDEIRYPDSDAVTLKTKPEVIHAEMNALMKLARSHESGDGATMFITHAPCAECAKHIIQSGIAAVYYGEAYRDTTGLDFLQRGGVEVQQLEREPCQPNTANVQDVKQSSRSDTI